MKARSTAPVTRSVEMNAESKRHQSNVSALFGWTTMACVAVAAFRWCGLHNAPQGVTMLLFAAAIITTGGTVGALFRKARAGAISMAVVSVACFVLPWLWRIRGTILEIVVIGSIAALLVASRWPFNWNDRRIY
jgi:hypothetical protein